MSVFPTQSRQLLLDTLAVTNGAATSYASQVTYRAAGQSNRYGYNNARNTQCTWKLNLRNILGDELFMSYRKFNLVSNWLMVNQCADIGSNSTTNAENFNDRSLFFTAKGLRWDNNFSISLNNMNEEAVIGSYSTSNVGTSEQFIQQFGSNNITTFVNDGREEVDFTITWRRTVDQALPRLNNDNSTTSPTNLPNWQYMFTIYPVADSKITKRTLEP